MANWKRIRDFSPGELALVGWAAILVVLAWAVLPLLRFRAAPGPAASRSATGGHGTAEALARLVGISSRHVPVPANCLHRSLVLWWLLRRRGIACRIRLGTTKAGGSFEAHAWVECTGVPVGEDADRLGAFTAFDRLLVPALRMPWWPTRPSEIPLDVEAQGRFGP
jgi:hypothetical protein